MDICGKLVKGRILSRLPSLHVMVETRTVPAVVVAVVVVVFAKITTELIPDLELFNADDYEMTDTISLMTSGIFNLLSFSSSRESTNDTYSVSGHDNMSNIACDGGNGGQVRCEMNGRAVWGGIGGLDGRGGLWNRYYVLQKWTQYVGWGWDDDNKYSTNSGHPKRGCSKDKPQELSSDRLVDHESDTFIGV